MQRERILKLRTGMLAQGITGVLLTSPESRYYFSNFRGTAGALLITQQESLLFTDFRYVDQATEQAPFFKVVQHRQNLYELMAATLKELPVIQKIGLEYEKLPAAEYLEVKNYLPGVKGVPVDSLVAEIRMFKDRGEVENIRKGIDLCDQAFQHILTYICPGITEKAVGLELEFFMRKAGAEGIKSNHVIASGERSALPHGQATDRVLKQGDFLTMDFGAIINGYYTDFTRTVVLGEPSPKQREIYDTVLRAQEAALAVIGPGKVCAEMDEVARAIIREAGYGENFGHSLGHSLGLSIHEKPGLRSNDYSLLQPGMMITVEPGIYIPGFGGVRIEDLVAITENGIENLTKATKILQVIN